MNIITIENVGSQFKGIPEENFFPPCEHNWYIKLPFKKRREVCCFENCKGFHTMYTCRWVYMKTVLPHMYDDAYYSVCPYTFYKKSGSESQGYRQFDMCFFEIE